MKTIKILALILCLILFSVHLASCNNTPTIEISEDGYWVINGEKTDVKAEAVDGKDGNDGADGTDGKDGVTDSLDENSQELDFYPQDDGTYAVAVGKATLLSKIEIPAIYKGKPVTSIKHEGFYGCSNLTSIIIPNSVTDIGHSAFYGCNNLTSVVIPDGVTMVDEYAFYKCSSLMSIEIPDSVKSIGKYAFYYCDSLINVKIPDGVTGIEEYTFYYCNNLMSVVIPDSVKSIGTAAFLGCNSLTNVVIPNDLTSIGDGAFLGCDSLVFNEYDNAYYLGNDSNPYLVLTRVKNTDITSCKINAGTKFIHSGAFENCSSLKGIEIPYGVISIGNYAFCNCSSLTSVVIPNSITVMIEDVFYNSINIEYNQYNGAYYLGNSSNPYLLLRYVNDSSVTSFEVHPDTKFIYSQAFSNCTNLTNVVIPNGLIGMGSTAFGYGAWRLTRIEYRGTIAEWNAIQKHYNWKEGVSSDCIVYCADGNITRDGTVTYN